MRIRGALHVHSTFSHDGTLAVRELADLYSRRGYQFLALGEHSQDLDEERVRALLRAGAESSSSRLCIIPGIEYACKGGTHIVGIGVTSLIPQSEPLAVIDEIHSRGGFAVLAHPKPNGAAYAPEVLRRLDAAEIWNVGRDGKFVPAARMLSAFAEMQRVNANLLAVAAHDFHRVASFYDVGIEMDVERLAADQVLNGLRQGRYTIRSRFFSADPRARFSRAKVFYLRALSGQLELMRKARSLFPRGPA